MLVETELSRAQALCDRADAIKAARDSRYRKFSRRWRGETERAGRLTAQAARIRREALHRWSTEIVREASDITIIAAPVKEMTETPRGNEQEWGANVKAASTLNRHILNQAPASAQRMLAYKAEEAGIRCDVVSDDKPNIAIGAKLVAAGKVVRKVKRAIRRQSQ